MNPWTQLERLESWYDALLSGDYKQAQGAYMKSSMYLDPIPLELEKYCCLAVVGELRKSHEGKEDGSAAWLGLDKIYERRLDIGDDFIALNDTVGMKFHEIAWVVLHEGINPLRKALGLEPHDDTEEETQ